MTTCSSSPSTSITASTAVGFFFQAEDGIRDLYVTGVQTCALPILKSKDPRLGRSRYREGYRSSRRYREPTDYGVWLQEHAEEGSGAGIRKSDPEQSAPRSEERRVGKECRCGWWPKH